MANKEALALMITGCCQKEESSQLQLYRHYYSYALSICLRFAKSRESAMEMLNDGFLNVFRKIDQYDFAYPFQPWFRKTIVNSAIDYYRKYEQKNQEVLRGMPIPLSSAVYNEALDRLEFEDLIDIMQQLPVMYRMVFSLYVVEGLPHVEIAKKLSISVGTSKSNLSKARQKIRILLKDRFDIHFKSKKYG